MKSTPLRVILTIGMATMLTGIGPVAAEELAAALKAGQVRVRVHGNGGSSGDTIELEVSKTAQAKPGALSLTVARGTRLQSGNASDQSMVVAGVQGRATGGDSYEPTSTIEVNGTTSATYVLEGYCMNFEKDNPSEKTAFSILSPDPVLAAILNETADLSTATKQAAVWIHTDHATYAHVNEKFAVTKAEWAAAEAAVKKCQLPAKQVPVPERKPDDSRRKNPK